MEATTSPAASTEATSSGLAGAMFAVGIAVMAFLLMRMAWKSRGRAPIDRPKIGIKGRAVAGETAASADRVHDAMATAFETTRRMAATLDQKAERLEKVLRDADRRIAALEAIARGETPDERSSPLDPEEAAGLNGSSATVIQNSSSTGDVVTSVAGTTDLNATDLLHSVDGDLAISTGEWEAITDDPIPLAPPRTDGGVERTGDGHPGRARASRQRPETAPGDRWAMESRAGDPNSNRRRPSVPVKPGTDASEQRPSQPTAPKPAAARRPVTHAASGPSSVAPAEVRTTGPSQQTRTETNDHRTDVKVITIFNGSQSGENPKPIVTVSEAEDVAARVANGQSNGNGARLPKPRAGKREGLGEPRRINTAELSQRVREREEIYHLADRGLDAVEIADRLGRAADEVRLALMIRPPSRTN
ncbi:MAG: hypothetical protein AAFR38_11480 [Planctomycetota bacterium]